MKIRIKPMMQDNFIAFINHARRRPGDVCTIDEKVRRRIGAGETKLINENADAKAAYEKIKGEDGSVPQGFSFIYMEVVDEQTPEKVSTSQQALTKKSDEIKAERAQARAIEGGDAGGKKDDVI